MFECNCPGCGKQLQIPAALEEFSCLYCGERIIKKDLLAKNQSPEGTQAMAYYEDHILDVIKNHLGIDKQVTGTQFADAFQAYMQANQETFLCLQQASDAGCCTAEQAAEVFLDQLEEYWQSDHSRKQNAKMIRDTDKFVIAVFLVPMVQELQLPISLDFCKALQALWCSRHPKSPFYIGTYDELSKGFNKKILGLCFITTAICQYENKPDDCEELTAFRTFRDGFLRSCPDGEALIREYYDIAPGIVLHLDLAENRDQMYEELRNRYLQPCYEDILRGNYEACKERYVCMVRSLERKYLS